ncbi:hypothetical protein GR925_01605 [Streptomyces sp. HUCO-GS316]|uniref:hypothetical protein n=1 Tax=Streptomyces sp. HUCO-GS316 TaxID=2692198 RepID=UPI00136A2913|nr:hypothetical protein [Streptomyces sp. HUCO-GS316]MXM62179.1 hypothetical protein [Streptomyces sp. HUCO-GS316]
MDGNRYLPILRGEHRSGIVLDGSLAAREQIRLLADLYRHDPKGVGDVLIEIADLKEQVARERELGGLGVAAVVRSELVGELLSEIGGAEIHLDPRANRRALMQARSLAEEAGRIFEAAQRRVLELEAATAVARQEREERRGCPACTLLLLIPGVK